MSPNPADLKVLLDDLATSAAQLGMDLPSALLEKSAELRQRAFIRMLPNPSLREDQIPGYLRVVLGDEPETELVDRVTWSRRGPRLADEQIVVLERRQNDRCALCGVYLSRLVRPQVDHITPVALGGGNDVDNLQLLCQRCNLGKNALVGWLPGAPFLFVGVSARVRYCVLVRAEGRCQIPDCAATSLSTQLEVMTRIPESAGGRLILDNLMTACKPHREKRDRDNRRRAISALKRRSRHYGALPKDL